MEVKTIQIHYKKVKVKKKNIFTLKIMKNSIIALKYLLIMAYQLYTWKKIKTLHLWRNTYNK